MTVPFFISQPLTAHGQPLTDNRSQTTAYRQPLTDNRLPTTAYRCPALVPIMMQSL
ncbi:MAG: hypothetical protein IPH94_21315 [Saprospiraceae bacterium]|nr:hypothetical protein [Saprospiraceae bacterium]